MQDPISITEIVHLAQSGTHGKQVAHTLYTQLMPDRGFLAAKGFYATYAHTAEIMAGFSETAFEVFGMIAKALRDGNAERMLRGEVAHAGFQRLT